MDDALGVGGFQRLADLNAQVQDEIDLERLALDALRQRLPLHQLHHDERLSLVLPDLMNGADVRMVECRSRAGFAEEPIQRGLVPGGLLGEELEGDRAVQDRILRSVDDPHPPAAKPVHDAIMRDVLADQSDLREGRLRTSSIYPTRLVRN